MLLYQRYTGLEVRDRWSNDKWREQIYDLLLPFGHGNHSSAKAYAALRERADPAVHAFLTAPKGRGKEGNDPLEGKYDKAMALRAALSKNHIKKARLASRRARDRTGKLSKAARNGTPSAAAPAPAPAPISNGSGSGLFDFMGPDAMDASAGLIQSVWRAGQRSMQRDTWHGGWVHKTASGGGPVEKLREAWAESNKSLAMGVKVTSVPSLAEILPTSPRFARW